MSSLPVRHLSQRLTIQHLWALIILAGVFVFVNTHPIRPHDFWWHLTVGREILSAGQIPKVDTFSYTAYGTPYPSYQSFWLMEIVLYKIYEAGGAALVVFVQSLLITCAYFVTFLSCLLPAGSWRTAAFGLGYAACLGLNDWNVRPQSITFLLGAVFLFLILKLRKGSKRILAIIFPVLMVIWVNSHGSYPLGLFLLGVWVAQEIWSTLRNENEPDSKEQLKRIIVPLSSLLLTSLACLINPAGVGLVKYQQSLWQHSVVQNLVAEWAPPTFDSLGGGLFLFALGLTALILAFSPRKPTLFQMVCFVVLGYLGLRTSRGIVWFGLVMAPIVADHFHAILSRLNQRVNPASDDGGKPVVNIPFFAVILLVVIFTLPWFKEQLPMPQAKAGLTSRETPIQATEYLLEHRSPGNLFHAMSFGSYLIWTAQPAYRVFVDGRIELFSDDIWTDYLLISSATSDWEAKLEEYGVHTLMLSKIEQPGLVNAVLNSDRWDLVFEDYAALMFVSR